MAVYRVYYSAEYTNRDFTADMYAVVEADNRINARKVVA